MAASRCDAIALTKADHGTVADSFAMALTAHTIIEEEVFYPACQGSLGTPTTRTVTGHALTPRDARALAISLGGVLGHAHGRQVEPHARKAWRADLRTPRGVPRRASLALVQCRRAGVDA